MLFVALLLVLVVVGRELFQRALGGKAPTAPWFHELSSTNRLRDIYLASGLDRLPPVDVGDNPYRNSTPAELEEVIERIDRRKAGPRYEALAQMIKVRVEESYLPDGSFIPESVRRVTRRPAPPGSACAAHTTEPAQITCGRCGQFSCSSCTAQDGKHCANCLRLLAVR